MFRLMCVLITIHVSISPTHTQYAHITFHLQYLLFRFVSLSLSFSLFFVFAITHVNYDRMRHPVSCRYLFTANGASNTERSLFNCNFISAFDCDFLFGFELIHNFILLSGSCAVCRSFVAFYQFD